MDTGGYQPDREAATVGAAARASHRRIIAVFCRLLVEYPRVQYTHNEIPGTCARPHPRWNLESKFYLYLSLAKNYYSRLAGVVWYPPNHSRLAHHVR